MLRVLHTLLFASLLIRRLMPTLASGGVLPAPVYGMDNE